MSLFVNPAQFGEPADLDGYPRDEEHDLGIAADEGVDVVFVPTGGEMYPPGFQTWVEVTELGAILEGEFRPGHFRGVATVCLKLFNLVRPDVVLFGQKDAQQVEVLQRMVDDLDLELELRALPTVRDADGLALSSRNVRLSPDERERALALPRALATRDPETARADPRRRRPRRRLRRGRPLPPTRPRRRGPRRRHPPDRQRPAGGERMSTRPRTPAPAPLRPASCRSPSSPS